MGDGLLHLRGHLQEWLGLVFTLQRTAANAYRGMGDPCLPRIIDVGTEDDTDGRPCPGHLLVHSYNSHPLRSGGYDGTIYLFSVLTLANRAGILLLLLRKEVIINTHSFSDLV